MDKPHHIIYFLVMWDAENVRITNHEATDKSLFMRRIAPRDDMNLVLGEVGWSLAKTPRAQRKLEGFAV